MNVKSQLTRITIAIVLLLTIGVAVVSAQQKLQAEVVYLRAGGFFPKTITRPTGKFLLVVKNRSGQNAVSINVKRPDGSSAAAGGASTAQNQDFLLDLSSGQYVVSDLNHTQWSPMTITIQ